ncbi:MAG: membrane fusion protein MtrC [bacterium]|nr:membrane fusion protein MtrC [bacterium]
MRGDSGRRPRPALSPIAAALIAVACGRSAASRESAPAQVVVKDGLPSVEVSGEAEHRLGIVTVSVETARVGRLLTLAGDLLLPLARPDDRSNRSIFALMPMTTPAELVKVAETQIDADGQIAVANVQLDTARASLVRAERLLESRAGTRRALDEARAQVHLAEAGLRTAREKRALLGTSVFDAVQKKTLWVRVALYTGDLQRINHAAIAAVSALGTDTDDPPREAHPVAVPLSTNTAVGVVDVFYKLDDVGEGWRPGQRVRVAIPLRDSEDGVVVPAGAILYDVHGSTWIYVETAPRRFTRTRVDVRSIDGAGARLARGPSAGARVVTDGATELFGHELGDDR